MRPWWGWRERGSGSMPLAFSSKVPSLLNPSQSLTAGGVGFSGLVSPASLLAKQCDHSGRKDT